jgi:hypothetical protein
MGCNPIILLGQDLAFARHTHQSHADGAHPLIEQVSKNDLQKSIAENVVGIGNSGEEILTTAIYKSFADCFKILIQQSGKKCINAIDSNHGLSIPGAILEMPQKALDEKWPDLNPRNTITSLKSTLPWKKEEMKTRLKRGSEEIEDLKNLLMKNLHDLNSLHHNRMRSNLKTEDEKDYFSKLNDFKNRILEITDNHHFFNQTVWPHLMGEHILLLRNYYRTRGEPLFLTDKINRLVEILQKWFEMALLWSSLIEYELKGH